jgi:hypothetical protein
MVARFTLTADHKRDAQAAASHMLEWYALPKDALEAAQWKGFNHNEGTFGLAYWQHVADLIRDEIKASGAVYW